MGINVSGVQVLHNPADGRLRRKILPRLQSQGLQVGGGQVGGVLPYRSQAATAGQHSGHGQRQHRRQVMAHTLPVPGAGGAAKLGQVLGWVMSLMAGFGCRDRDLVVEAMPAPGPWTRRMRPMARLRRAAMISGP